MFKKSEGILLRNFWKISWRNFDSNSWILKKWRDFRSKSFKMHNFEQNQIFYYQIQPFKFFSKFVFIVILIKVFSSFFFFGNSSANCQTICLGIPTAITLRKPSATPLDNICEELASKLNSTNKNRFKNITKAIGSLSGNEFLWTPVRKFLCNFFFKKSFDTSNEKFHRKFI